VISLTPVPDLPNPSGLPHPSERATPPGWYPNLTCEPGKLGWDGRAWHAAIPVAPKVGPKLGHGLTDHRGCRAVVDAAIGALVITGEILGAVTAVFGIIGAIASVFGGIIVGVVEIVRGRGSGMSSSIASSTSMVLSWTEIEIVKAEQFKICPLRLFPAAAAGVRFISPS
jgi:hypothetical protein